LFERTVRPVKACLADAKLSERDIDELVLVGGMTRMPKVIETARKLIGKEPHKGC
jgi:molecular chaperone DnaK